MKKSSVIAAAQRLLVFLAFISLVQSAKAQCTPGFLGNDRPLILCSPVANIDYVNLFQIQATYNAQALLPATDTIKRMGQPDTVIFHQIKLQVIATLQNGCKDTAIIRIPFNLDPFPNIGRDTSFIICRGTTKDLSTLYNPAPFIPRWSIPNPAVADTGLHSISIVTRDGCKDTAYVSITHHPYISLGPDSSVSRKPGETANLFRLVDTSHFSLTWSTASPAAAPIGIHWVIGLDSNGCRDTAMTEVCKKPDLGADTTIKVCPGLTTSLYSAYNLTGLLPQFNTPTPSAVGIGVYRLIVTNQCGGKDTVNITVAPGTKPNIGPDQEITICENETTNLEVLYTFTGLTPRWSLATPDQAPFGTHRLIVKNADGCTDTTFLTVQALPRKPWYNDTTVFVCGGQTKDLRSVYPFTEETIVEFINITDPANAAEGNYTVAVEEDGCRYLLKITVASAATRNASISVCTYNTSNAPFTTNAFRSVIVDKQGFVWAGADGTGSTGGLYRFTRTGPECNQGTWTASTQFANSTYRDLHLSPINGDNSIWSASTGHSLSQAITGGVYKINSLNSVTRFGSVLDGSGGTLGSRLANAITIAPNNKLYVALAVSQTAAGVIGEGDVFETNLSNTPETFVRTNLTPSNVGERRVSTVGMRGNELWAAFQRSCINGTCTDPYIQRWNTITNTSAGTITQANSPILFTSNSSLIVRSIFTSSKGRTFVGLNTGAGFAVAEPASPGQSVAWILLTDQNSAFPKGAAINFNAITEVNGEIWMGTTLGILVYDGVGPLTECSSYTLYNTSNGLPSNNVTDIAYDTTNQEIWITSSAGVSRVTKSFTIAGKVQNIFLGKFDADLQPKMFTRNIENASVTLLDQAGTRVDSVRTNANGEFNLANSLAGKTYTVRVRYKTFTYEYSDVAPNSFIGNVLIPDSLIKDITALKEVLKRKEFTPSFPGEQFASLLWKLPKVSVTGFDTTDYEKSYEIYTNTVTDKHKERLENLAIFYLTLTTINDVGKLANDLAEKAIAQAVEIITGIVELRSAMADLADFQALWKQGGTNMNTSPGLRETFVEDINKLIEDGKKDLLKTLREELDELLNKNIRNAKGSDGKPLLDSNSLVLYEVIKTIVNQTVDQLLLTASGADGVANLSAEDIKEQAIKYATANIVKLISLGYYKYYTQVKHEMLIPKLATYTKDAVSTSTYGEVYQKLYDKGFANPNLPPSILKEAIDLNEEIGDVLDLQADVSKSTKFWSDVTKTAGNLALSTVALAEAAPLLRGFSVALQGINLVLQGFSMGTAVVGAVQVGNLSDDVVGKTGFPAIKTKSKVLNETCVPISAAALSAAASNYKQKLNECRILTNTGFDSSLEYSRRYRAVLIADSVYRQQLSTIMHQIAARYKNAANSVPGFEESMNELLTKHLGKQAGSRAAFMMEHISYILTPDKSTIAPRLDTLTDNIIADNFIVVALINDITTTLNQYCVPAGAYLVKTGYSLTSTLAPGSSGSFSYTFTNFGAANQNQVRFKISAPTNGFLLTSPDSVFAGTIQPGQSFTVNFSYTAPNTDTTGDFTLDVMAANGDFSDEIGSLITILATDNTAPVSVKAGNWSDQSVWNTGRVPDNTSAVTIRHNVVLDVDAQIRSITVESPAQVQVAPGRRIRLVEQRP